MMMRPGRKASILSTATVLVVASLAFQSKGILVPDWSEPTKGTFDSAHEKIGKKTKKAQPWSITAVAVHTGGGAVRAVPVQVVAEALQEHLELRRAGTAGRTRPSTRSTTDPAAGAAAATQHLLDLGHRTVWHIAGPMDWLEAEARRDAWRDTLASAGAAQPDVLSHGDWSPRSGYEAGRLLVERNAAGEDITAVFVANDQMALGVLRALREAGLDVPRDVSIVGFDDIPEAEFFSPPLTTVRQDFAALGRNSIGVMLDQIEDGASHPPPRVVVPASLIVRSSTTAVDGDASTDPSG